MQNARHPWLLPLASLSRDDLAAVGAKNLSIGLLSRLGLSTPPGFALSTEAFSQHLRDAGVSLSAGSESELDRRRIQETPLGSAACEAIAEAAEALLSAGHHVAARSSLYPFEDDPQHACAGLFVSRLNLASARAIEAAVVECFASLWHESAVAYFQFHGLDRSLARMSVGLQATVDAVASATVFTQDPITHNERVLYLDAAHGFGGVTNSALVETDSFFLEKGEAPRIISRRKGTKRRRLVRKPQGGLDLVPNTSMGFALDDDVLLRIARDAARIEAAMGAPQDVELAVTAQNEIIYLQSRGVLPATRTVTDIRVDADGVAPLVTGTSVVFGAATAPLKIHHDTSRNADAIILKADLAVRDVPKMYGARGLIVRDIPPTSHPAIHLREMGVPTLSVGERFTELSEQVGAVVTLDTSGEQGALLPGARPVRREEFSGRALPATPVGVHLLTTYPSPRWSSFLRDSPIEGVHVRGESVNNDDIRTHPLALLAYDEDRLEGAERYVIERRIAGYLDGASFYVSKFVERLGLLRAALRPEQSICLRLTDLMTSDYRRLVGGALFEDNEENPVLGMRGAARLLHPRFRRVLELELTALAQAAERFPGRYEVLVPVVRAPEEMQAMRAIMASLGLSLPLGMMVETPAAVLLAPRFVQLADFFCIGAADLTQFINGADRTLHEMAGYTNPLGEATRAAVMTLMKALAGHHKDVHMTESLYLAMAPWGELASDQHIKVVTWPDRLLKTLQNLSARRTA